MAGQTARFGLNFLWTLMGGRWVLKAKKIEKIFFKFYFHGQRRTLQLVYSVIDSYPSGNLDLKPFFDLDFKEFFDLDLKSYALI